MADNMVDGVVVTDEEFDDECHKQEHLDILLDMMAQTGGQVMAKLATCSECGETRQEQDGQWKPWVDGVGNPLYVFLCNKCNRSVKED